MFAATLVYIIALAITLYDKYCVMLNQWEKPGLYQKSVPFIVFSSLKLTLIVAYSVLFYYSRGLLVALGAVAFQYFFGATALRIFFSKQVGRWYPIFIDSIKRKNSHSLSGEEIQSQAAELAHRAAMSALKNEFPDGYAEGG